MFPNILCLTGRREDGSIRFAYLVASKPSEVSGGETSIFIVRRRFQMGKKLLYFGVFLCVIAHASIASAQVTTGTISGITRDETDAVIPGVTVTLRNRDTGATRTVITDDRGYYHATNLSLGDYEVRAELLGFQVAVRRGLSLTVSSEAVVDFTMRVGEITEQVVVESAASLIETTSSVLSGLVENEQIQDLPLNGRGLEELALLQPGVIKYQSANFSTLSGGGATMSILGVRPEQNVFLLDGTDINDMFGKGTGGAAGVTLGVDAIRELKVFTSGYSAEYGRAAGGTISAVTKSGTNAFHGTTFWFHRNDNLDATEFFDNFFGVEKPEFKRNQFGGTVGGPIVEDQTFFLFSYESLRDRLGTVSNPDVPNALAHQGFIPIGGVLTDVGVDPAVAPYLELYPLPNSGVDNGDGTGVFLKTITRPIDQDYFMGRIDHRFSESDTFFARYTYDDSVQIAKSSILPEDIFNNRRSRRQYLTLSETRVFSPVLINVFTVAFNRTTIEDDYQSPGIPTSLHLVPNQDTFGSVRVSGLPTLGNSQIGPRLHTQNMFQYRDDVTWSLGDHSVKIGVDIKRFQYNVAVLSRFLGSIRYRGLDDFLVNDTWRFEYLTLGTLNEPRGFRTFLFGFYIQDDFRVSPRLTLNLGLRYEPITVPTEVAGRISNIRDTLNDVEATVGDPYFENPSLKSFAPRVGFAWDPFGDGKSSVRGAFGIFYDQISPPHYNIACCQTPPFKIRVQVSDPPFPFPVDQLIAVPPPGPSITAHTLPFNMSQPYVMQYNLSVQREILPQTVLNIGYSGAHGVHLARIGNVNIALPEILTAERAEALGFPDRVGQQYFAAGLSRRNPNFGFIAPRLTDTNSIYNALLLSVRRRFSQGLHFQGSYTFSNSLDMAGGVIGGADAISGPTISMDPYDPGRDKGPSNFNITHNLVGNFSYQLPFGSSLTGAAAKLVRGWQLTSITRLSSGRPQVASSSFDRVRNKDTIIGGGGNFRVDLKPGADSNPVTGDINRWWDPDSFELQPRGFYGNLGKNTLEGPGLVTVDFSLIKNTAVPSISEDFVVQLRFEFFNALNRANFRVPSGTMFRSNSGNLSSSFARIRRVDTRPREIQIGIKILF